MAIILLIQNNGKISKLPMKNRTITFGRSSKSDIKIDDQMMSGQHFSLTLTQNRILTVKDLESTNGTFLNGSKIENSKIFIGDQISVGGTVFALDKASMNKHELNYFTPDERTSVRFIKAPTNQKTLSIKRDIYEEFDIDESDPKKKEKLKKSAANKEPDISINFDNDGELKAKVEKPKKAEVPKKVDEPSKKDITTSEVIDSSKITESDLERKAYQATGATQFIKLDKDALKSKKKKRKKGKKSSKKKKKEKKPESLFGKLFSLFKK